MKILLIDDMPDIVEPMAQIIQSWGHFVIQAEDGYKGFCKLLTYRDIELIITDLHMPVWDGYKFAEEAKKISQAPILFHTGEIIIKASPHIDGVVSKGDLQILKAWITYFIKN